MISLVITCDTRPMSDSDFFTVGDNGGTGSLQGCRSFDFLTDGVDQKLRFFRGYPIELIICVDVHEPIPPEIMLEMEALISKAGNGSKIVLTTADKSHPRWYDVIQLNALRHATGQYVAKFDQDANAMAAFPCEVVDEFIQVLNKGLAKFICQPSNMHPSDHGMWWASTRFFMCRRETLDIPALERAVQNPLTIFEKYHWVYKDRHLACLEHILGVMGGINGMPGVIFPPRSDSRWLVWSWVRYKKGLIKRLNEMPYGDSINYLINVLGMSGPNDILAANSLP